MKQVLKNNRSHPSPLMGTLVTLPAPEIAEILCTAGFDWLFVDLEHSTLNIKDAQTILQAVTPRIPCILRVPLNDEIWIKKSLDTGASGVIVPQILSAEEAAQAVQWCKYPPEGTRSFGIARAQGYGAHFKTYVDTANADIAVILQIEHKTAIENIETIVKVPGIDCLFIGPYDLSVSMGKMGQVNDPEIQDAIAKVKQCADEANIPTGIFGAGPEAVRQYIESGYTLIAMGIDTMIFGDAARKMVDALR